MKNKKFFLSGALLIAAVVFISFSFTHKRHIEHSGKLVMVKSERTYFSKCGSGDVQSKEENQSKTDVQKEVSDCNPKNCDKKDCKPKDCKGKKSECKGKKKECKTKKTSCTGKKKECKTSKKPCSGSKKK